MTTAARHEEILWFAPERQSASRSHRLWHETKPHKNPPRPASLFVHGKRHKIIYMLISSMCASRTLNDPEGMTMNFKSIKSKIAFSAGAGLLITAAILVGYSISSTTVNNRFINKTVSTMVERITLDKMQSVAAEYAQSISRRLEKGMQTAQTLADAAAATHADPNSVILNRTVFNGMLSEALKSN